VIVSPAGIAAKTFETLDVHRRLLPHWRAWLNIANTRRRRISAARSGGLGG
jgi:hypothetical protein